MKKKPKPTIQVKPNVRRAELLERLLRLCRDLDVEMDGVRCPATAAAILNGIRYGILNELNDRGR